MVASKAAWFNADIPFTTQYQVYFENAVAINGGTKVVAYQFGQDPRIFDTKEKIKVPTGIFLPRRVCSTVKEILEKIACA